MRNQPLLRALLLLSVATAGCRTANTVTATMEKVSAPSPAVSEKSSSRGRCSAPVAPLALESAELLSSGHREALELIHSRNAVEATFDREDRDQSAWRFRTGHDGNSGDGSFRAAQGWFIGINAAYVDITDDDLDGSDNLAGPDTIVLPLPDDGTGGGASIGYRFDSMAFELTYYETQHDAVHLGTNFDTTFKSFSLNLRNYFRLSSRFQPFLNLGLASTEYVIENGATATLGGAIDDAVLEDQLSVNLGFGGSLFITPRLSLNVLGEYRFLNKFNEAKGVAPKGGTDRVSAEGITVVGSLTYIL